MLAFVGGGAGNPRIAPANARALLVSRGRWAGRRRIRATSPAGAFPTGALLGGGLGGAFGRDVGRLDERLEDGDEGGEALGGLVGT